MNRTKYVISRISAFFWKVNPERGKKCFQNQNGAIRRWSPWRGNSRAARPINPPVAELNGRLPPPPLFREPNSSAFSVRSSSSVPTPTLPTLNPSIDSRVERTPLEASKVPFQVCVAGGNGDGSAPQSKFLSSPSSSAIDSAVRYINLSS